MGLVEEVGAAGVHTCRALVSISVLERTRELGVMLAIGATPERLERMFLTEGLAVAVVGWVLGVLVSWPLTLGLDAIVGTLGFLAPLPFVLDARAPFLWLVLVVVASFFATWVPARSVLRLTVREALARV
ncbi:MAG: ABC transporter permease [Deltaproteobacteria bacterium]|nr:ABC transporter permease [Deltaproteobacteria bacterium]